MCVKWVKKQLSWFSPRPEQSMSVELYRQYLAALVETPHDCEFVEYEWGKLPDSLPVMSLPYRLMFTEFSVGIANGLNDLINYTQRLKAWSTLIAAMTDQEKLDVAHEFIYPVAIVSLNLPYVIKSRFIFAAAHLCHQANQAHDGVAWKDDLRLDHKIVSQDADKHGAKWSRYDPFRIGVEGIGDKTYVEATHNFRHTYNHRFSPNVVIGFTRFVTRKEDPQTKAVKYVLGQLPPLTLDRVADLLAEQCKRGRAAFEAFQNLVREHEKRISQNLR
jgi:hypothetical protein